MYNMISTTESLYRLLFRYSENALREHYGHKRKVTTDFNYKGEVKNLWDAKILSRLDAFIKLSLPKLQMPDELTELSLNAQNTGRWKFSFEKIIPGIVLLLSPDPAALQEWNIPCHIPLLPALGLTLKLPKLQGTAFAL